MTLPSTVINEAVSAESAAIRHALDTSPAHLALLLANETIIRDYHYAIAAAIAETARTPDGRLNVTAPPRAGKSWLGIVWTAVWIAARNPRHEIVIACASDSLSREHGAKIRDIITVHGPALGIEIRPGHNRQSDIKWASGGSLRMVGIGSQLTGHGAHWLLIDDAYRDWQDAHSSAVVRRSTSWFRSVAMTRLYPYARVIHTTTIWSSRDFVAMTPNWPLLRIPAVADSADDPLGRTIGEPLLSPTLRDDTVEAARSRWDEKRHEVGEDVWKTLYQGKPSSQHSSLIDSATLARQQWPDSKAPTSPSVVAVDPSTKETGSADTCGIVLITLDIDKGQVRRMWVRRDYTGQYTLSQWVQLVLDVALEHDATIMVEGNQGGDSWAALIASAARDGNVPTPHVDTVYVKRRKIDRAGPVGVVGHMRYDRIRISNGVSQLLDELANFDPARESPGSLDATSMAARQYLGTASEWPEQPESTPTIEAEYY